MSWSRYTLEYSVSFFTPRDERNDSSFDTATVILPMVLAESLEGAIARGNLTMRSNVTNEYEGSVLRTVELKRAEKNSNK